MSVTGLKKLIFPLLIVLVVGQAIWIAKLSSGPGHTAVENVEVAEILFKDGGRGFDVKLSEPLGSVVKDPTTVVTLAPEVKGEWRWSNPYVLEFEAESPLGGTVEYTMTFDRQFGFAKKHVFVMVRNRFALNTIRMSEEAGRVPGDAEIAVSLSFNAPVSPEDLLEYVTLVEEPGGAVIPLQARGAWTTRTPALVSESVKKTVDGRQYVLTVKKGLPRSGSAVALVDDSSKSLSVRLDPVLKFRGADPLSQTTGSRIQLTFSTPMDPVSAKGFIEVQPQIEFSLSASEQTLTLGGEFKPGKKYKVIVREGLVAADGAVLAKTEENSVVIPDLQPSVEFVGNGMFLTSQQMAGLAFDSVNVSNVGLRVDRVYPNNLFSMLSEYGWRIFDDSYVYGNVPQHLGSNVLDTVLGVRGKKNKSVRTPVEMRPFVKRYGRGLYRVTAQADGVESKRWALFSDIGLAAKQGERKFTVWAVSNTTLKPLSGVRLRLISDKRQTLVSAKTSASGMATLKLPNVFKNGHPFMIFAEKGKDFTFLLPHRFGVDMSGLDVSGVETTDAGLRAYIYGERDLYRPGETLKGAAILRRSNFSTPPVMPVVLTVTDPKGRMVRSLRLKTNGAGMVPFEIPIADYSLTGNCALALSVGNSVVGTWTYKVEEFIPDRIKVEVDTDLASYAPGSAISTKIIGTYLYGPPAANLATSVRMMLRAAPMSAKGFEQYVFSNPNLSFQPQQVFSDNVTLDKAGRTAVSIPVPDGLTPPSMLEATIYGRVSETGGRGVTARKTVAIHPYAYYVGIKQMERRGFEPGKPVAVEFVTVGTDGAAREHGPLVAKLYRDRWRTVVRKSPSGGFRYESVNDPRLVREVKITKGQATGRVEFTPAQYGGYSVEIASTDGGSSSVTSFFCGGWGNSPWAMENPSRVELVADKTQYSAGETAIIQVRSPFPGRMIAAVEGDSVDFHQSVELTGNTGEVRIPIKKAYGPNRYVTVMVLRKSADVTEGGVGRAYGAIPLLVDTKANTLALSLNAPDEIRPDSSLAIELKGKPGAVATVAVVDEGIVQLSGAKDPDPFDFFYARRALGVQSSDTFAMLYPDLKSLMRDSEAGGGMAMAAESQFMRTDGIRRVKPVSYWSGPITLNNKGVARVDMRVPDFQGALRIVACGVDGKTFGATRTMTRVRSPLALTPTLPRFMATGDSIEMPVAVRNDTGAQAAIEIGVDVKGSLLTEAKPVSLTLQNKEEQTVYLPISASDGAGGKGQVTVTATSAEESRTVHVDLPVRPYLPRKREIAYGTVKDAGGPLVDAATGLVPETLRRTVEVSRRPAVRLAGRLDYLLRYPYGCAEQTVSKAFPLIRYGDLCKALAPGSFVSEGAPAMVQAALMRLGTMQTGEGGFAYWPGMDRPDVWVSAYATHFLLEATQAGFSSPGLVQRATDYMFQVAGMRGKDIDAAAYALFNLSKAGQPQSGAMDEMRDHQLKNMGGTSRALLASAYAMAGDMDSFNFILSDVVLPKEGRAASGGMRSGLSDTALMLLAIADAKPSDPLIAKLAARVGVLLKGDHFGSTFESALAFAALGKTLGETDDTPLNGALIAGDARILFDGVVDFRQSDVKENVSLSLELTDNSAPVYWSVATSGVPMPDTVKELANGLQVRQSFFAPDGLLDMSKVEQGQLVIMKTEVTALKQSVDNVVVQVLLPAGLEVENPRLEGADIKAFSDEGEQLVSGYQDLRDDRVLFFTDLQADRTVVGYTQLRAVVPGEYALPSVQAESMYDPSILAHGVPSRMGVVRKK